MSTADDFRAAMSPGPPPGRPADYEVRDVLIKGLPACTCGCGLPARIVIQVAEEVVAMTAAATADQLIDSLTVLRQRLWGPRRRGKG